MPVGNFFLVQQELACRKHRFALIICQAIRMIGMHVGQEDSLDLSRIDAGKPKILWEPAQRLAHRIARTSFDESKSPTRTDDERVHRAPWRNWPTIAGKKLLRLFNGKISRHGQWDVEITVTNYRHTDIANAAVINTGHLLLRNFSHLICTELGLWHEIIDAKS